MLAYDVWMDDGTKMIRAQVIAPLFFSSLLLKALESRILRDGWSIYLFRLGERKD